MPGTALRRGDRAMNKICVDRVSVPKSLTPKSLIW